MLVGYSVTGLPIIFIWIARRYIDTQRVDRYLSNCNATIPGLPAYTAATNEDIFSTQYAVRSTQYTYPCRWMASEGGRMDVREGVTEGGLACGGWDPLVYR